MTAPTAVDVHEELIYALRQLLEEIPLHKFSIRKDRNNFSLLNAHAYATKILRKAEGRD